MKNPSLSDLKNELIFLPPAELVRICLRLAKYKKENKELMGYLLFDSNYEPEYIERIKVEVDGLFAEMNKSTLYFAKKSIRKILRITNKYIRYSGQARTEAELRIHFCTGLKRSGVKLDQGRVLGNLFDAQMQKVRKAVSQLHEDLQHDYSEEIRDAGLEEVWRNDFPEKKVRIRRT